METWCPCTRLWSLIFSKNWNKDLPTSCFSLLKGAGDWNQLGTNSLSTERWREQSEHAAGGSWLCRGAAAALIPRGGWTVDREKRPAAAAVLSILVFSVLLILFQK